MFQFSSGSLYGLVNGTALVPRKFGALQDVSLDISYTKKSVYGQNQFALAIARGQAKITGKAKWASLNAAMLNDLFFSAPTATTQSVMPIFGEAGVIPTTPFQVTVANGTNFVDDLGVYDPATGLPYLRVAAAPATGQYSVSNITGIYTFAAADVGKGVVIDYTFKVATTGLQLNLAQTLSGTTPTFSLALVTKYAPPGQTAKPLYLKLNMCTSDKLTMATKMDDFQIPEFDFEAMADAAGNVGAVALGE